MFVMRAPRRTAVYLTILLAFTVYALSQFPMGSRNWKLALGMLVIQFVLLALEIRRMIRAKKHSS